MENVRHRRDIELVTNTKRFKKLVADPRFKSATIFHNNLSAVKRMKKKVYLNKPNYIGLCVLEVSKWLMYNFYYNVLQQIFPPQNLRLIFTDTDSLCISVKNCNNYAYDIIRKKEILNNDFEFIPALDYFDLSTFSNEHRIFSGLTIPEIKMLKDKNKKVPGKMKDELNGQPVLEFVGQRAKTYAFKWGNVQDDEIVEKKTLKGIQRCVVKSHINFDQYKSSLFNQKTNYVNTCSIRSTLHQIETKVIRKVALGPFDDKKYLLNDGITSLPYGYYEINNQNINN